MHQHIPCSNPNLNKTINDQQLSQIIEAIIDGKYSWACVLLLRFIGENPLHYIPYRTHNRLVKENHQISKPSGHEITNINLGNQSAKTMVDSTSSPKCLSKITDLACLEMVDEQHSIMRGGNQEQWLDRKIQADHHSNLSNGNIEIKSFSLKLISFFKKEKAYLL